MLKEGKQPNRPCQKRVNLNTPTLSEIGMDIKYIPCSSEWYILVSMCKETNFLMVLPFKTTQTSYVCTNIIDG